MWTLIILTAPGAPEHSRYLPSDVDPQSTLHTKNRYRVEWCAADTLEAHLNLDRHRTDFLEAVVPMGTGFYLIWRVA